MENFLGWFLESSLLVLMITGIRKLFSGKVSYLAIYALWLVVALRFLLPVNFISVPFSAANIFSEITAHTIKYNIGKQESKTRQSQNSNIKEKGKQPKKGFTQKNVLEPTDNINNTQNRDININTIENKISNQGESDVQGIRYNELKKTDNSSKNIEQIIIIVWITGTLAVFFWLILSNAFLLVKVKKSRVLYGRKKRLKIYSSDIIKSPCLYGLFCPAVYLPDSIDLSYEKTTDIEQIIIHEYVHYRHCDHIWAAVRMVLVSIYWFDPFIWLAASLSKKDAELFCDETVLRLIGEKNRFYYGKLLLRLAKDTRQENFNCFMMSVSRKGKDMEKRIRAISIKRNYAK